MRAAQAGHGVTNGSPRAAGGLRNVAAEPGEELVAGHLRALPGVHLSCKLADLRAIGRRTGLHARGDLTVVEHAHGGGDPGGTHTRREVAVGDDVCQTIAVARSEAESIRSVAGAAGDAAYNVVDRPRGRCALVSTRRKNLRSPGLCRRCAGTGAGQGSRIGHAESVQDRQDPGGE